MNRADAEILWDVASLLARDAAKVSRPGRTLPPVLFFTDPDRTPRPWETAARLPPGAGVVFRHFGRPDARETALRLREATRTRENLLLIGRDAELADAVEADGLHLPGRALGEAAGLAAARPAWTITGAVHAREELATPGLDALIVSPVFPAGGASSGAAPLGLPTLKAWAAAAACPVYALGGVDAGNAHSLIGSGVWGIAGVSAVRAAFGPD